MITVLAGINGAGKSSILGSWIRQQQGEYFNPDEAAQWLMQQNPTLSLAQANGDAWALGRSQLQAAITHNTAYTFETTLGGNSICRLLLGAINKGIAVNIAFCGLQSPELHIERVAQRVANGGHPIAEAKIRERWVSAIHNMCSLIPGCHRVTVFDNSIELRNGKPTPQILFAMSNGKFTQPPSKTMPDWAKPLAVVAMQRHLQG